MSSYLEQYILPGSGASSIASQLEKAIALGNLSPGDRLTPIRELAERLQVSPATVAAAYRVLKDRGLTTSHRRRGTVVSTQPEPRTRGRVPLPLGVRDLASGNPDPALLPPLAPSVSKLDLAHRLYGGPGKLPDLVSAAAEIFGLDGGVDGEIAVTNGALDGIERALSTITRPNDRVVIEDPCWPRIADLIQGMGLRIEPARVDERGLMPEELQRALSSNPRAVIVTPRGQNPTGAAVDTKRALQLQKLLAGRPEVLVIEDDYLWGVSGAPYVSLHDRSERWVVIRSVSKVFGPDLRLAVISGDALTVSVIDRRQMLGPGWVSHLLQQLVADLWSRASTKKLLARAERAYSQRRQGLLDAFASRGIPCLGASGFGVWVEVPDELSVVQILVQRGWGVSPGERYRHNTHAAIRITTTSLNDNDIAELAEDFRDALEADFSYSA